MTYSSFPAVKKEQQAEYKKVRNIFNNASGFNCVQKQLYEPFLLANPAGAEWRAVLIGNSDLLQSSVCPSC